MMRLVYSALAALALVGGVSAVRPVAAAAPKKHAAATKAAKPQYVCKMDGIMSAKPGKCPKCGMAMTKIDAKTAKTAKYECKMDGLMSAKGGKCPKCGMDMTKIGAKPAKKM
jgi:ribosomal protein S27AE